MFTSWSETPKFVTIGARDQATFATELIVLAVRGFGDMGKRARDSMIRDRCIAAQRNCGLRQLLTISRMFLRILPSGRLSIVAECGRAIRIGSRARMLDSLVESDNSRKLRCLRTDSQELLVGSGVDSRVPVSGVGVCSRNVETPRMVGEEDGQLAPLQAISSLVTRLLQSAQEGRLVDEKAPSEGEMGPLSAVSPGTVAERSRSAKGWVRVCFSCGRQNRCSQVDTSFPFLPPGWSVDVRNGQYRATWIDGTGLGSPPGNEGWSGQEGQPPGSSEIKVRWLRWCYRRTVRLSHHSRCREFGWGPVPWWNRLEVWRNNMVWWWGHTLVDASSLSASILMINPNAEESPVIHVWANWFQYRLCRWLSRIRACRTICA